MQQPSLFSGKPQKMLQKHSKEYVISVSLFVFSWKTLKHILFHAFKLILKSWSGQHGLRQKNSCSIKIFCQWIQNPKLLITFSTIRAKFARFKDGSLSVPYSKIVERCSSAKLRHFYTKKDFCMHKRVSRKVQEILHAFQILFKRKKARSLVKKLV